MKTIRTGLRTRVRGCGIALAVALAPLVTNGCTTKIPVAGDELHKAEPAHEHNAPPARPSEPPKKPTDSRAAPSAEEPGATESAPPIRKDGTIAGEAQMMGTQMSIIVWVPPEANAALAGQAVRAAFLEISRIESIASEWRADSDLSRLNNEAGQGFVDVAPELVEILRRSKEISADTEGSFDVSFHSVGQLWRFKPGAKPPSDASISAALPHVNWRNIVIGSNGRSVRLKDPAMRVGLGAIAKGYAVDVASRLLAARGLNDHIVEAGGDTFVRGSKAGKPWMVGVQDPDGPGSLGAIPARDEAVVTSGNYQRYFEFEGTRYSHILDPKTGRPIPESESPKSVTLVAHSATTADALCTAVAVMGPKKGMDFVESRPGVEAVIVTAKGEALVSTGLRHRYRAMRPATEAEAGPGVKSMRE